MCIYFLTTGQRSDGAIPESLLETEKSTTANKLILGHKLLPVVSLYSHAPTSNFCMILVPLDYMYYI